MGLSAQCLQNLWATKGQKCSKPFYSKWITKGALPTLLEMHVQSQADFLRFHIWNSTPRTKTTKKFRRTSYDSFSCLIYWPQNLINYEKGAGYRSWNQYFRILHKILVKLDQKYVVYNALLPETDTSLIKNQHTTFVVFNQSVPLGFEAQTKDSHHIS